MSTELFEGASEIFDQYGAWTECVADVFLANKPHHKNQEGITFTRQDQPALWVHRDGRERKGALLALFFVPSGPGTWFDDEKGLVTEAESVSGQMRALYKEAYTVYAHPHESIASRWAKVATRKDRDSIALASKLKGFADVQGMASLEEAVPHVGFADEIKRWKELPSGKVLVVHPDVLHSPPPIQQKDERAIITSFFHEDTGCQK